MPRCHRLGRVSLEVKPSFWRCFETLSTFGDPSRALFSIVLITNKNTDPTPAHTSCFLASTKPREKHELTSSWTPARALRDFQKHGNIWEKDRSQRAPECQKRPGQAWHCSVTPCKSQPLGASVSQLSRSPICTPLNENPRQELFIRPCPSSKHIEQTVT